MLPSSASLLVTRVQWAPQLQDSQFNFHTIDVCQFAIHLAMTRDPNGCDRTEQNIIVVV